MRDLKKRARFALKYSSRYLEIPIEISKEWPGNSMAKHAIFPGLSLKY